jgi:hypothetical protein
MMRWHGFKLGAALMLPLAIFAARGLSRSLATDAAAIDAPQAASALPLNVMNAHVWAGPYGNYFNGPFTTVTICRSGTDSCESISGILIDTGSFGLRIFGQVNHLTLATETTPNGTPIAECVQFGSLSTWGRVAYADVKLGGEPTISKVPIQLVNPSYSVVPAVCKSGAPLAQGQHNSASMESWEWACSRPIAATDARRWGRRTPRCIFGVRRVDAESRRWRTPSRCRIRWPCCRWTTTA